MHLLKWIDNWLGYHIGLYFPLSSKGQIAAISTDAVSVRVRYLPPSYFGKYLLCLFFKALRWPVFFLSELNLTLKTVKGRCSPLPVLEDFHWSGRFSSVVAAWLTTSPFMRLHLYWICRSCNCPSGLRLLL